MKKSGVSTQKIAGTYIGTVVGAGFATGQEILQFFADFGIDGLWGIALTTALFMLFGYIIMELGRRLGARSHLDIIRYAGGRMFGTVMDVIVSFFLFASLSAMIAGTGALFAQQFGLPSALGNAVMAGITLLTVLTGINGVINAISMIVPFLLVSVIGISLFSITKTPPVIAATAPLGQNALLQNWLLAAILYTSYNTVISIAVLGPLGARAKDKSSLIKGAILGGLGLGVGSVMIFLALCGDLSGLRALEVPMAHIAGTISRPVQNIYAVVLIAEVYTTAVGALYGFTARMADMEQVPGRARTVAIATTIAALFASLFGFSNLVKYVYPVIGCGGIVLLVSLLYRKAVARRAKTV